MVFYIMDVVLPSIALSLFSWRRSWADALPRSTAGASPRTSRPGRGAALIGGRVIDR